MTKQEEIAAFLDQHVQRCITPWASYSYPYRGAYGYSFIPRPRSTAEELGQHFYEMAEFKALGLGSWLGTTEGQIITEAVGMLAPPLYRDDVDFLVSALQYAALLQQVEGRRQAGNVALGVIGVALILALFIGGAGAGGV